MKVKEKLATIIRNMANDLIRHLATEETAPDSQTEFEVIEPTSEATAVELAPEANQVESVQPETVIIEKEIRPSVRVSVIAEGTDVDVDVQVSVRVKPIQQPYTHQAHDRAFMRDGVKAQKGSTRYLETYRPAVIPNFQGKDFDQLMERIDQLQAEADCAHEEEQEPATCQIIAYRELSQICEALGAGVCQVKPLTHRDYYFAIIGLRKAIVRHQQKAQSIPKAQAVG